MTLRRIRNWFRCSPGDVPVTYADTSALAHDFGYRPGTSLREGLRRFAEWYAGFYHTSDKK